MTFFCDGMSKGESHEKKGGGSASRKIVFACLFLFSYGILVGFSMARDSLRAVVQNIPPLNFLLPLTEFQSLMFWLVPLAGFFLAYYFIGWYNDYFETRQGLSPVFPIALVILCFVAFYIAFFWYVQNLVELSGAQGQAFCFSNDHCNALRESLASQGRHFMVENFSERFQSSPFVLFMWSGILAWASAAIIAKLEEKGFF